MNILILGDSEKTIQFIKEAIAEETNYSISKILPNLSFTDELRTLVQSIDMIIIDTSNYSMSEIEKFTNSINYNLNLEDIVLLFIIDPIGNVPPKSSQSLPITDYIIKPFNQSQLINKLRLHVQYKYLIHKNTYLKYRALEATANAIAITDLDGNILWINSAFTRLTGYEKVELIGKNTSLLKSAKQDPRGYQKLWSTIVSGQVWRGDLINKRKDGSEYHEEMTITPLVDEQGVHTHYIAIKQNITERKEREKQLLLDVNLAKQVQKGAISKPLISKYIHIDSLHMSSENLSGDMCAWYELDNNRYGIILYDVMGHGLSAALITMSIRSLLRGIISKLQDPEQVIQELNHHTYNLFQDNDLFTGFFFTAVYVLIDLNKKEIQYVNAGHPPAILIDGSSNTYRLNDGCLPCGIFPNLSIKKGTTTLSGQTKICLFTDGLMDAIDIKKNSVEHAIKIIEEKVYSNRFKDNQDVLKTIKDLIGMKSRDDDICVVSIDVLQ